VQFGTLGKPAKSVASVKVLGQMHHFPMDDVIMIIEARVEELFEYVDAELTKIGRSRKLPGGAVLTGGTAKLPGISEFARDQLQLPARVGKLQTVTGLADTVDDPAYYTVIGLMLLDMLLMPEDLQHGNGHGGYGAPNTKAFGFVEGLFGRLKR
jgi:cell division protein FtsA